MDYKIIKLTTDILRKHRIYLAMFSLFLFSQAAFGQDDITLDPSEVMVESDQEVVEVNSATEEVNESVELANAEKDQLPAAIKPTFRQRPGEEPKPTAFPPFVYESVPDINSSASEFVPVPNRWSQFYVGKWYDPYNQNILKADLPIFGSPEHPWFFELSVISDLSSEYRKLPIPVGAASTDEPESTDPFGRSRQFVMAENLVVSLSLFEGNTSFKPQDFEFRFVPAFNLNYADVAEDGALRVDPSKGDQRTDSFVGIQEWFADIHLANISERYDFVSSRIGIQQFVSDFRGFIFNSSEPGVRLFGNYDNNLYQFNLAYFHRLDKDTNSGLNTWFEDRHEDVYVANLYSQDTPVMGHTLQGNVIYRSDKAGNYAKDYDNNGFQVRPASIGDERPTNIYTTYLGITGDGHFDRINTTEAFYYVTGSESHNPIAQRSVDVSAEMAALEVSYDRDWVRFRTSFFWASGDDDAFDGDATGFDAIFDNPNFAGGDISFWQRQGIPFIGGGLVNLTNRNSLLANLRPGKEEGQSNFVNPGVRLYNMGVDFEITPKLKLINNASYLQFDKTETLEALRQDGHISREIGWDFSSGLLYRPFLNNNVQIRAGGSMLVPQSGLQNLYKDETLYTIFSNLIFQY